LQADVTAAQGTIANLEAELKTIRTAASTHAAADAAREARGFLGRALDDTLGLWRVTLALDHETLTALIGKAKEPWSVALIGCLVVAFLAWRLQSLLTMVTTFSEGIGSSLGRAASVVGLNGSGASTPAEYPFESPLPPFPPSSMPPAAPHAPPLAPQMEPAAPPPPPIPTRSPTPRAGLGGCCHTDMVAGAIHPPEHVRHVLRCMLRVLRLPWPESAFGAEEEADDDGVLGHSGDELLRLMAAVAPDATIPSLGDLIRNCA